MIRSQVKVSQYYKNYFKFALNMYAFILRSFIKLLDSLVFATPRF